MTATASTIAITYPFALGTRSGGSTALFHVALELARAGAGVVVAPVSSAKWTTFPRRPVGDELMGRDRRLLLEEAGVEVVEVPPHPVSQWLEGRNVARALSTLARRREIDAILGFHHEASRLPALAGRLKSRFAMLALWQSYRVALLDAPARQGARRGLVRWLNRRTIVEPLRRAERVFATSEFTRGELLELLDLDPAAVEVCPLGIDPVFSRIPRRRPEGIRRLIFFGRLVESKGVEDALEALGQARVAHQGEWTFRMMGDGDAEGVRRMAADHGIGERVEVIPFQGREALCRELEEADLALMPSYSESFGLSIAEAQAAGLAVVAYRCGSVPEIVEHGVSGWLAPFGDRERLARHLAEAMSDPEATHRAGLAGRKRVTTRFTWVETARCVLRWLESDR